MTHWGRRGFGLACALSVGLSAPSYAAVGVEASLSTLGPGFLVTIPWTSRRFDVRVGVNDHAISRNGTYTASSSNVPYTATVTLKSVPVLFDYHPFRGAFRLTGGLVINDNAVNGTATPTTTVTLNGNTYSAAQVGTLTAQLAFRRIAPYLGLGWGDHPEGRGLSAGFDLGVLFQGAPEFALTATNPSNNAQLAQDVQTVSQNANNRLSRFRLWPVVGFNVGYAF